jgi:hypothetical protein
MADNPTTDYLAAYSGEVDQVENLRLMAAIAPEPCGQLMQQAADEIERLRAGVLGVAHAALNSPYIPED